MRMMRPKSNLNTDVSNLYTYMSPKVEEDIYWIMVMSGMKG